MKVLRVRHAGVTFYGQLLLRENAVVCLDQTLGLAAPLPLPELTVLSPLAPSKVVCVEANFPDRLRETGRSRPETPGLFLRPPTSVAGSGQDIVLPEAATRVVPGGQLALVLGRTCRNLAPEAVPQHLFGYCCANGITAADLFERDDAPGRATGYDTFAPMGPWIETAVADPSDLVLRTRRNGRLVQEASTADMLFSPFTLVSFVSSIMTLLPGDVILTGAPAGGEALAPGDEVRVEIDALGVLINPVRARAGRLQ